MTDVMENIKASLDAAQTFLKAGQSADAEELCLEVLGQVPEQPDALMMIGLARKAMGDLEVADKAMVRAINADDSRADFYLSLGNVRRECGKVHDAAKLYAMALDKDAGSYEARLYLGEMLLEMGELKSALSYLTPLTSSHPDHVRVWRVFGDVLRAMGRSKEAIVAYDKALGLDAHYGVAHHNKAAALNDLGQHEKALEALEMYGTSRHAAPQAHINRAHALMGIGNHDEAALEYTHALTQDPGNCQAHRELANLLWMTGKPQLLTKTIERARSQQPDNHRLTFLHANLLREAGRPEAARDVLTEAFPDASELPHTQAALAALALDLGAYNEALNLARKAVQALPADVYVQDSHMAALLALGRGGDAIQLAASMRQLYPHDQRWIGYEATALRLLGDERYKQIFDYERLVQPYDLPVPTGWSSQAAFLADLKSELEAMHKFQVHPLDQSLRHGSQTTRDLSTSDNPVLKAFFKALDQPVRDYMAILGTDKADALGTRNTGAYRFRSAWSVKLRPGGFHVSHVHPQGWISSAFYVDVSEAALDTPERQGWIKFGEPGLKTEPKLPAEHWVRPAPGRLVLFPSYMWHGTEPFTKGDTRITLPFDVVPA